MKLAIVESGGRFVGLHVTECPEMRFIEICDFELDVAGRSRVQVDPLFLEVIEPGTLQVIGLVCAKPLDLRAEFAQGHICISSTTPLDAPTRGTVTVCAVARGHHGRRFPEFTAAQKASNEAFWASALQP